MGLKDYEEHMLRQVEVRYKVSEDELKYCADGSILNPQMLAGAARGLFGDCDLGGIYLELVLDVKNRPIGYYFASKGEIIASNETLSYLMRSAIVSNAGKVAFATFSEDCFEEAKDKGTRLAIERIAEARGVVGAPLMDFVIIERNGFYSFKEEGESELLKMKGKDRDILKIWSPAGDGAGAGGKFADEGICPARRRSR